MRELLRLAASASGAGGAAFVAGEWIVIGGELKRFSSYSEDYPPSVDVI